MYFSEPLGDFRSQLHSDDGKSVDIDYNATTAQWRLTFGEDVSRDTLAAMIRYLHGQFYPGEDDYLADWLAVAGGVQRGRSTTITLKTVDRL
jgi:hypothetical protein